jgi:gamma-glutamyltranspeptidase/glutathione hydrolase
MIAGNWRTRAGTVFETEKRPAFGSRGMVVTNHPLGSAAGVEMLAAGGNAVDAAVAALFALTVLEPMMVGIFGAGHTHLRLADGRHVAIDNYTVAPAAARPDMYQPLSDTWPDYMRVQGDQNALGALSVGVPGTLKGWCEALERFGRLDLPTVLRPAIRHAAHGFRATPYLCEAIHQCAGDLARFPDSAAVFLPGGAPPRPGDLIVQPDYAESLGAIANAGPQVMYGGELGHVICESILDNGGILTLDDLRAYATVERRPVIGTYRGFTVAGPPPPSGGGIHLVEMLNLLEGFDVASLGYGTADGIHLLAEVLKIAFADREAAVGDPAFVNVPVERLTAKDYAAERRGGIDLSRAGRFGSVVGAEALHTTHVTVADAEGNVVTMTQTLEQLFGSKLMARGTGILLNDTMGLFDPHPGRVGSIAPGKRMTSSMAPTIVFEGGRPRWALGLPGGRRIFPSVLQAVLNLIDHGMSVQEAVEAPRVWTQGQDLEIEGRVPQHVRDTVAARGHAVTVVSTVGGGMGGIAVEADGTLTGAACWRADGSPIGISGGLARPGVRFNAHPRRAPGGSDERA